MLKSLIQTNIKNIMLACYGYKLVCVDGSFCKPLSLTKEKMLFKVLSIVWLKKKILHWYDQ